LNVENMNKYFDLITRNTDASIVSIGNCKHCSDEFALYDIEKDALDKQGFKYPDICAKCRFRMLYSYLNDRHLYHREDSLSGDKVVSIYSADYSWDIVEAQKYKDMMVDGHALKYGRELWNDIMWDFKKLYADFLKPSRMVYPWLENSEYASHSGWAKNLYLSFCIFQDCEDIFYSYRILGACTQMINVVDASESSQVYSSRMIESSHDISFSSNISDSNTLMFCYNMQSSNNCLFCCNLVNAKYQIWNKQYTKQEYEKISAEISEQIKTQDWYKQLEEKYREFLKENLIEPSLNIQNSEAIAGDNIYYSSNSINSFKWIWNQDCVNTILTWNDRLDKQTGLISSIESGQHCENVIGCCSFGQQITNLFFMYSATNSTNCYYCMDLADCDECMFSTGLRNKKHCILNKQYSEEQYFEIKEKIITHLKQTWEWGDFLGFDMSLFPYNDTSSYDFWKVNKVIYPDGREEIVDVSAKWIVTLKTDDFISEAVLDLWWKETIDIKWRTRDKEVNVPDDMNIMKDVPSIDDISDDILNKALICEKTWRPFRIIPQELEFLRKKWFPIPSTHHEVRIDTLLKQRPVWELHVGNCDKCSKDMLSVFSGEIDYRVYCPECYKNYMFQ